jgi:hypothetical protein
MRLGSDSLSTNSPPTGVASAAKRCATSGPSVAGGLAAPQHQMIVNPPSGATAIPG